MTDNRRDTEAERVFIAISRCVATAVKAAIEAHLTGPSGHVCDDNGVHCTMALDCLDNPSFELTFMSIAAFVPTKHKDVLLERLSSLFDEVLRETEGPCETIRYRNGVPTSSKGSA